MKNKIGKNNKEGKNQVSQQSEHIFVDYDINNCANYLNLSSENTLNINNQDKNSNDNQFWIQYSIMAMRAPSSSARSGFDSHYCQRNNIMLLAHPHQVNNYNYNEYKNLLVGENPENKFSGSQTPQPEGVSDNKWASDKLAPVNLMIRQQPNDFAPHRVDEYYSAAYYINFLYSWNVDCASVDLRVRQQSDKLVSSQGFQGSIPGAGAYITKNFNLILIKKSIIKNKKNNKEGKNQAPQQIEHIFADYIYYNCIHYNMEVKN